jgi:hypothetical protein
LFVQLSKVHLPGAGLGENEKRHDNGLMMGAAAALAVVVEAWESGSTAAVLALFSRASRRKKVQE